MLQYYINIKVAKKHLRTNDGHEDLVVLLKNL